MLPVLVYYHGGGWTIGDLDTHDVLCRQLCNGAGAAVVSVDYRHGPGAPLPGRRRRLPRGDALGAPPCRASSASTPARLAVGGDSAGGNLAAVVSILARDAGDLPIAFQLLIYPATDMRRRHASHTTQRPAATC